MRGLFIKDIDLKKEVGHNFKDMFGGVSNVSPRISLSVLKGRQCLFCDCCMFGAD